MVQPVFLLFSLRDLLPYSGAAAIVLFILVLVGALRYLHAREVRWRASVAPLCSWEYPASEWPEYAERYDLAKVPKGAAKVKITSLDVWIADDGWDRRNELDGSRTCVTGCMYEDGMFKIRVRSWAFPTRYSTRVNTTLDLWLPVPPAKREEVLTAVEYFRLNIANQPRKIESVVPANVFVGPLGETDL